MSSTDAPTPEEPNTSIDPYDTLGIASSATEAEIRSAYKKRALKHHPDKVAPEERESANKQFQAIAFAYAVLSDPIRRKRYDATGSVAESALDDDGFDWTDFFRAQYSEISAERISQFELEYKHSEEERGHLLAAYEKRKGKMSQIYEDVMLSNPLEDEDRFQQIISEAIEKGEVEEYKAFTHETEKSKKKRMDRARKEAEQAEKYKQELEEEKNEGKRCGRGKDGIEVDGDATGDEDEDRNEGNEIDEEENEDKKPKKSKSAAKSQSKAKKAAKSGGAGGLGDLAAMIQQRQKGRASTFLDDLEAKYAPKAGKGKKRAPQDEPPEEAFAKNARKSKKAKA